MIWMLGIKIFNPWVATPPCHDVVRDEAEPYRVFRRPFVPGPAAVFRAAHDALNDAANDNENSSHLGVRREACPFV